MEMAAPALCQMTPAQFHDFIRCVEALVRADNKLTLFEYTLQRLLIRHVVTHFVRAQPPTVKYTTISPLIVPVTVVLSALAYAGEQTPEGAARAFAEGVRGLCWPGVELLLVPGGSVGIAEIDAALEVLALAHPRLKKQIVEACAACICVDGTVTIDEGENYPGGVRLPGLSHAPLDRVGSCARRRFKRNDPGTPLSWSGNARMMPADCQRNAEILLHTPRLRRGGGTKTAHTSLRESFGRRGHISPAARSSWRAHHEPGANEARITACAAMRPGVQGILRCTSIRCGYAYLRD